MVKKAKKVLGPAEYVSYDKQKGDFDEKRMAELSKTFDRFAKELKAGYEKHGTSAMAKYLLGMMSSGEFWRMNQADFFSTVVKKDLPIGKMFSIIGTDIEIEDVMRALMRKLNQSTMTQFEDESLGFKTLDTAISEIYNVDKVKMVDLNSINYVQSDLFRKMKAEEMVKFKGTGGAQKAFKTLQTIAEKERLRREGKSDESPDTPGIDISGLEKTEDRG